MGNLSNELKISASLLAADFKNFEKEIVEAQKYGCDEFHFDVMDGIFVPEISMGPIVLKSIRSIIKIPIEVHLMVENPENYIHQFADIGVDIITFHVEASSNPSEIIKEIKSEGVKVGLAKSPNTSIDEISEFVSLVDRVLVMCVEPGYSGQEFDTNSENSLKEINDLLIKKNIRNLVNISVDGGINSSTIKICKKAGVQIFVSGSSIFWDGNVRSNIMSLKNSLKE